MIQQILERQTILDIKRDLGGDFCEGSYVGDTKLNFQYKHRKYTLEALRFRADYCYLDNGVTVACAVILKDAFMITRPNLFLRLCLKLLKGNVTNLLRGDDGGFYMIKSKNNLLVDRIKHDGILLSKLRPLLSSMTYFQVEKNFIRYLGERSKLNSSIVKMESLATYLEKNKF